MHGMKISDAQTCLLPIAPCLLHSLAAAIALLLKNYSEPAIQATRISACIGEEMIPPISRIVAARP
jgi:hypothetical protein